VSEGGVRLAGRTALVTGAGVRLGRAVALALAEAGADVVVHYLSSRAEAAGVAAEIEALGRRSWLLRGDLSAPDEADRVARDAIAAAGRVDILVSSASVFPEGRLREFSAAELAGNVQVNAMAPLQLARAVAAQGIPADVINFVDCRILEYDAAHVPYHLSKRMLAALTREMAVEFAPLMRVNAVAPGLILPPRGEGEEYLERLRGTNPLGARGGPDDVTRAVLFLLASPFITGQVIFVDGGRHLRGSVYG